VAQAYKLRCANCGAPLPQPRQGEEYVRCEYCGYWNKIADSEAYTVKLLEEVKQWVYSLIPRQIITSTTADLVARHHLFQENILPKLTPKLATARAEFYRTMARSLIDIKGLFGREGSNDPKRYFEEAVKLEGLSELVVTEEDSSLLNLVTGYYNALAYINNALVNAAKENYSEAARNLAEAYKIVEAIGESAFARRIRVASEVYRALGEIMNRNPQASKTILEGLSSVDPADRNRVEVVATIVDWSNTWFQQGRDPLEPYVRVVEYIKNYASITGGIVEEQLSELVKEYARLNTSKAGVSTVRYVAGVGDIYMPFYLARVSLTLVAGGLLRRRGDEAAFDTLIPASTPLTHPPVVDLNYFLEAKEKDLYGKINAYTTLCIQKVKVSLRNDYLNPNTRVLPPLTTRRLAEKYFYDQWRAGGGKLKVTNVAVEVGDLIYLPANVKQGYVELCDGTVRLYIKSPSSFESMVV
jgi:hypothetical protein